MTRACGTPDAHHAGARRSGVRPDHASRCGHRAGPRGVSDLVCHLSQRRRRHARHSGLEGQYKGQPAVSAVLTDRTDLTPATIKFFVPKGVSVMPFFRKTEIGDADLEAMTLFLTRRGTP